MQATEWREEDYGCVKDEYEYQAFCERQRSSTVSAKVCAARPADALANCCAALRCREAERACAGEEACARGDSDELLREWLFARLDGVKVSPPPPCRASARQKSDARETHTATRDCNLFWSFGFCAFPFQTCGSVPVFAAKACRCEGLTQHSRESRSC